MKKMMKKTGAAFLASALVLTAVIPVYASDTQTESLQLTTTQAASYLLTIPLETTVEFGAVTTEIGTVKVNGNIGTKQQVKVTATHTDFVDTKDDTNKFSFKLQDAGNVFNGDVWNWQDVRTESQKEHSLQVVIPEETWKEVPSGTYQATLNFVAELADIQ